MEMDDEIEDERTIRLGEAVQLNFSVTANPEPTASQFPVVPTSPGAVLVRANATVTAFARRYSFGVLVHFVPQRSGTYRMNVSGLRTKMPTFNITVIRKLRRKKKSCNS